MSASLEQQARFWTILTHCSTGAAVFGVLLTFGMVAVQQFTRGVVLPPSIIPVLTVAGPVLTVLGLVAWEPCFSRKNILDIVLQRPERERARRAAAGPIKDRSILAVFISFGASVATAVIVIKIANAGPWSPEICEAFGGESVCKRRFYSSASLSLLYLPILTALIAYALTHMLSDLQARYAARRNRADT